VTSPKSDFRPTPIKGHHPTCPTGPFSANRDRCAAANRLSLFNHVGEALKERCDIQRSNADLFAHISALWLWCGRLSYYLSNYLIKSLFLFLGESVENEIFVECI
jgi:hypothetical protein